MAIVIHQRERFNDIGWIDETSLKELDSILSAEWAILDSRHEKRLEEITEEEYQKLVAKLKGFHGAEEKTIRQQAREAALRKLEIRWHERYVLITFESQRQLKTESLAEALLSPHFDHDTVTDVEIRLTSKEITIEMDLDFRYIKKAYAITEGLITTKPELDVDAVRAFQNLRAWTSKLTVRPKDRHVHDYARQWAFILAIFAVMLAYFAASNVYFHRELFSVAFFNLYNICVLIAVSFFLFMLSLLELTSIAIGTGKDAIARNRAFYDRWYKKAPAAVVSFIIGLVILAPIRSRLSSLFGL